MSGEWQTRVVFCALLLWCVVFYYARFCNEEERILFLKKYVELRCLFGKIFFDDYFGFLA